MAHTHGSYSCQHVLRPAALLAAVGTDHGSYSVADRRTTRPPSRRVLPEYTGGV